MYKYSSFENPETYSLIQYIKETPNLINVIKSAIESLLFNQAEETYSTLLNDDTILQEKVQEIVARALTRADAITFSDISCTTRIPVNYNASPLESTLFQLSWLRINWKEVYSYLVDSVCN